MNESENMTPEADWDPRSSAVLEDQIRAYDLQRRRCPVSYSEYQHWSVLRHADVLEVLLDHARFSNQVSRHRSVPNGMDPPEHGRYRSLIEPYFDAEAMRAFVPECERIARKLVEQLPVPGEVELMGALARDFALHIQCAFMGWSEEEHEPLRQWIHDSHEATLSGDPMRTAAVAEAFDARIRARLKERHDAGAGPTTDRTAALMHESIAGTPLSEAEIVSIIRNWTVGELGTIAASIGILGWQLAQRPELQRRLRAEPGLIPAAIDELLRLDAPLIANRRVTTEPVCLAGREIPAGARLSLIWASANRDEAVFGDPDVVDLERDPALNLLYGAGVHVCPGAALARLELRLIVEALFERCAWLAPVPGRQPERACYPAGGYASVPLRLVQQSLPGE